MESITFGGLDIEFVADVSRPLRTQAHEVLKVEGDLADAFDLVDR